MLDLKQILQQIVATNQHPTNLEELQLWKDFSIWFVANYKQGECPSCYIEKFLEYQRDSEREKQ